MTDAELSISDATLIARLRMMPIRGGISGQKVCDLAADRIELLATTNEQLVATNEALTKERDDYAHKLMQSNNTYTEMHLEIERLSDKLATCEKYRDAYAEMGRIGTQAVRDLEAKLAENEVRLGKAVEALDRLVALNDDYSPFGGELLRDRVDRTWQKARAALARVKGETK